MEAGGSGGNPSVMQDSVTCSINNFEQFTSLEVDSSTADVAAKTSSSGTGPVSSSVDFVPTTSSEHDNISGSNEKENAAPSLGERSLSPYERVKFHGIQLLYPTDTDLLCNFSLLSGFRVGDGDKIAMFPIAWKKIDEFITCVEVPKSRSRMNTGEIIHTVVFKGEHLPQEADKLYQFCYLSADESLAGASSPFGFEQGSLSVSDFSEEEDSEDGIVVVRPRITILKETNQKLLDELTLSKQLTADRQQILELSEQLADDLKIKTDQADQSARKCADLQEELFMSHEANELLKRELIDCQKQIKTLEEEKYLAVEREIQQAWKLRELEELHSSCGMKANEEIQQTLENHNNIVQCLQESKQLALEELENTRTQLEQAIANGYKLSEELKSRKAFDSEVDKLKIDLEDVASQKHVAETRLTKENKVLKLELDELRKTNESVGEQNALLQRKVQELMCRLKDASGHYEQLFKDHHRLQKKFSRVTSEHNSSTASSIGQTLERQTSRLSSAADGGGGCGGSSRTSSVVSSTSASVRTNNADYQQLYQSERIRATALETEVKTLRNVIQFSGSQHANGGAASSGSNHSTGSSSASTSSSPASLASAAAWVAANASAKAAAAAVAASSASSSAASSASSTAAAAKDSLISNGTATKSLRDINMHFDPISNPSQSDSTSTQTGPSNNDFFTVLSAGQQAQVSVSKSQVAVEPVSANENLVRNDVPAIPDLLFCPICNLKFPFGAYASVELHVELSHLIKDLACPVCTKTFAPTDEDQYGQHVQGHFLEDASLMNDGERPTNVRSWVVDFD